MLTLDTSKPVRTRSGQAARIICADRAGEFPIVALYAHQTGERMVNTHQDGRVSVGGEHPLDLVNVPEGEATYPLNPLFQLLADPAPAEFQRVMTRLQEAMATHPGGLDDGAVALAIMVGTIQEVRARASLPLTFSAAVAEWFRLRTADAELTQIRATSTGGDCPHDNAQPTL